MEARAEADPMVDREGLLWMAGLYLDGADPRTPLASPLYAVLSGLPPLLIQVTTDDRFVFIVDQEPEEGEETPNTKGMILVENWLSRFD